MVKNITFHSIFTRQKTQAYYILSFVFHDQDVDLTSALDILNQKLNSLGLESVAIHTGPVIRQEEIYNAIDLDTRRKIMRVLLTF